MTERSAVEIARVSREQVEAFEASNGAEANTVRGDPIVVVTNVGAMSGAVRKTPVMRVERDGRYLMVASLGGAPTNPAWVKNLRTNPHVELQDGGIKRRYVARELDGAERDAWWEHAVATWSTYASYQAKTDRLIPLFLLEPDETG